MKKRQESLPFDWTSTTFDSLCKCIDDDFKHFFRSLKEREDGKSVIDYYGIDHPHAFDPAYKECLPKDWKDSKLIEQQLIKYQRRIYRFGNILSSGKPVCLIRNQDYSKHEAEKLCKLIETKYPTSKFILCIVSNGTSKDMMVEGKIHYCQLDFNLPIWNDPEEWKRIFNTIESGMS